MAGSFEAQISAWVAETQARTEAVFKESAQRVIEEMQRPGPSVANPGGGQGGALPIASGFLRHSLAVTVGSPSSAMRDPPDGEARYQYDGAGTTLAIAGADIGDTIFAVYTARYAQVVNYRYQFVGFAADQWQRIVNEVCVEAQTRATA